ncbi:MAG: hypothetical protein R3277_09665 [Brumimicrobium sp.]|nr:hypothetical protein [Brumimicrobium sp.]
MSDRKRKYSIQKSVLTFVWFSFLLAFSTMSFSFEIHGTGGLSIENQQSFDHDIKLYSVPYSQYSGKSFENNFFPEPEFRVKDKKQSLSGRLIPESNSLYKQYSDYLLCIDPSLISTDLIFPFHSFW